MKKTSDDSTGQPRYNQIAEIYRLVYALYGILKSHTVTYGVIHQIVETVRIRMCRICTGVVLSSDEKMDRMEDWGYNQDGRVIRS